MGPTVYHSCSDILALGGGFTVLANPLTFGKGLQLQWGGSTYDNTLASTVLIATASNSGLTIDGNNALAIDLDGSTLSMGASGISVASVPSALTHGTGISTLSFDGSSAETVAIDTAVVPRLGSTNTFSANNTFSGTNTFATILAKHDEVSSGVPYLVAGSNVSVSYNTPGTGQITVAASLGGNALTNGSGIGTFSFTGASTATVAMDATSLSQSGNRSSYVFLSNGTTTITKQTVAGLVDLVDRTAIMAEGTGIDITFPGATQAAIIATKIDSTTIGTDGSGNLTVNKVPNSLTQGLGIKAFSFDGSAGKTVAILDSIVATLTGSQFSGNIGITGSLGVESKAVFNSGLSGSLTTLADGSALIRAGTDIEVVSGSTGWITIHSTVNAGGSAGGGNSDKNAEYLVLATTSSLGNERVFAKGTGLTTTDAGAGGSYTVGIDNSIVATLTGSVFSGNIIAQSGLTGSLQMLSNGTTPYIIGTGGVTVTTASSGQVIVSASNASSTITQAGGSTIANVNTLIFTASTVSGATGTATITPVIGAAEDSSYADGLFTDFSYTTPIGTAVDRFNEVLKGLAPGAAPSLDDINCNDTGANAKLSFGSSSALAGYTNALPSALTPTDNLSDIDVNGTFSSTTTSNDVRVACFAGQTTIDGTLNADVSADGSNYSAYSFGNADQGTLKLFVNNNSTPIHTVDLSTFGSGNSLNGNSSGFNLTAKTPGHFSDGSNFATFQHRQGTYTIAPTDQRDGWNYARVVHTISSTDTTCNYIEWVNDTNVVALTSEGSAMDSLSMTGTKNLSGVKYNTGGSAEYRLTVLNAYRNIYSTSNITFNGTNASVSSQAFPVIDYGAGENDGKILNLVGPVTITADPILDGSITVSTNVPHPLKSNLSSAGPKSISGILLYNLSNTSTVTSETFRAENYRVKSGSYDAQADVTNVSNTWDSTTSLTGVNGLMFYNSRLYAPIQGGDSGDFRNTSDGGTITNGPSSNPNYSALTSGLRTFYRYFQNTSGGSKSNWSLTINGSGTIVSQGTALNSSRIHILAKLPTTSTAFATGWMDLAVAFATGQVGNGDGCLDGSLDSSLNATNSGTFGTQSVGANEYIVIKIEADGALTGYISSMSISWS